MHKGYGIKLKYTTFERKKSRPVNLVARPEVVATAFREERAMLWRLKMVLRKSIHRPVVSLATSNI